MRRRLVNLLTGLSLLMCVAAVFFWARSYFASDEVRWIHAPPSRASAWHLSVRSDAGVLRVEWVEMWWPSADVADPIRQQALASRGFSFDSAAPGRPVDLMGTRAAGFGVRWSYSAGRTSFSGRSVDVPFWPVLLAASFVAGTFLWLLRRRHLRHKVGLCPACGYDLRATPDKCPECGHVPAAAAA